MKLRVIVALAVLVSGGVHLKLWWDVFRHTDVVGPMFLLNVVAALVIAGALLLWRSWPPLFVAVGFGLSTLVAFTIAATVGLFGVHEKWISSYPITANVSELVAVAVGAWALYAEGWLAKAIDRMPSHHAAASSHAGQA